LELKGFDLFISKYSKRKTLLTAVFLACGLVVLALLFVKNLPLQFQRSWMIVPAILIMMFCSLGIMRHKKILNFFNDVFSKAQVIDGQLKVTNTEEWQEGVDYYADLSIGRETWEVHFYPLLFDGKSLLENQTPVQIFIDDENKPAIVKTDQGSLFVSAARRGH
jgi:hypothetical protein